MGYKNYYLNGQPCNRDGCLSKMSHPCDSCGRFNGRGEAFKEEVTLVRDFSKVRAKVVRAVNSVNDVVTLEQAIKQVELFNRCR